MAASESSTVPESEGPRRGQLYITTPIYYVNDAPHIGHAYTTVLADAVARWHRLCGDDVFFLTGTDEHGLKVQQAAVANGVSPQEWADRTARRFQEAWRLLEISHDDFIRTTEERHRSAVQQVLEAAHENGDIYLGTYEGLYCVACEAYYRPEELADGNCVIHGRPVRSVREENYFFRLSRYEERLARWFEENPQFIRPSYRYNEALSFIRGGLQDFSISRTSLSWGVPIPWDPGHVTYVWFDALTNYITAAGYGSDEKKLKTWWPHSMHVMAKDILRFHAVYWPAMLMSVGLTPPSRIQVHGFLLVAGEKMSKTRLNQVSPGELAADFGVDALRYYLLREQPAGPDGDFSYEAMVATYNGDLANGLGNLLSRVSALAHAKCGGTAPPAGPGTFLLAPAREAYEAAAAAWGEFQPSRALAAVWKLIHEANALLDRTEPWRRPPGADVSAIVGETLEVLRILAILLSPAMPSAAREIWRKIGVRGSPERCAVPGELEWGGYEGGVAMSRGTPLFPRR